MLRAKLCLNDEACSGPSEICISSNCFHMLCLPELLTSKELAAGRLSRATLDFLEKDIDCVWNESDDEATFSRKSAILSTKELQFLYG